MRCCIHDNVTQFATVQPTIKTRLIRITNIFCIRSNTMMMNIKEWTSIE